MNPTSANLSSTHWAARSHSSGGNWRGSATDFMATSSASSVTRLGHQLGDARAQVHGPSLATSPDFSLSTNFCMLGSSSGQ